MRSATRPDDPEPFGRLLNSLRLGTLSPGPWDLALGVRSRIKGQGDAVSSQHRPCSLLFSKPPLFLSIVMTWPGRVTKAQRGRLLLSSYAASCHGWFRTSMACMHRSR